MEAKTAAAKAPVAWGPEGTHVRSRHPRARNPVVARETVVPVARRPDQVRIWARRLFIDRHRRGRFIDRKFDCPQGKRGLDCGGRGRWRRRERRNGFRRNPPFSVPDKGSSLGCTHWYLSTCLLLSGYSEDD